MVFSLISGKKANIIPIHKKGNKHLISNYSPVSLLPICGKILERLMYNSIYKFFDERKLLNPKQSGFKPGDSCVNQLIQHLMQIHP